MASSKLDIVISVIDKASAQMKGIAGSIKRNEQQIRSAGRGLTVFGAGITALGGLGVKAAIDFESAFAGVVKTVNASQAELDELSQGFRELATEIPVAVGELAGIGATAGQLGIATENILGFTRVMADLGVTTNLTSEEAATAMARIANVTGLPQDEFDRLGSTVVELGNNLATTEAEILHFGQRIAGAGEIAGITEAQILAIGGAMTSVGVQAEAGGTAVQKVLIAMTDAATGTGENLEQFAAVAGMSASQFATAFADDAAGAFTEFVEGLGRSGTDAFAILEELGLQDQRLIRSFLTLSSAGDLLSDSMDLATKAFAENTALAKEAELRYATTASQLKILMNNLNELLITLGEALIPVLQDVVANLRPVITSVGEWMKDNPGLTATIVKVTAAIGIFAVVLGPLLIMLPGLVTAISALSAALLFLAANPVGAVITALALLVIGGTLLIKHWDKARDVAVRVWNEIADVIRVSINGVIGVINSLIETVNKVLGFFGRDLIPTINTLDEGFLHLAESINDTERAMLDVDAEIDPFVGKLSSADEATLKLAGQQEGLAGAMDAVGSAANEASGSIDSMVTAAAAANDVWARLGITTVETSANFIDLNTAIGRAEAVAAQLASERAIREASAIITDEPIPSAAGNRPESALFRALSAQGPVGGAVAEQFETGRISELEAIDILKQFLGVVTDSRAWEVNVIMDSEPVTKAVGTSTLAFR